MCCKRYTITCPLSSLRLFVGLLCHTPSHVVVWTQAWADTFQCSLLTFLPLLASYLPTWLSAHRRKVAWGRVWRPTQWPRSQTSFSSISRPRTSFRTPLGQRHPCRSLLALPPPQVQQQQQQGGGRVLSTHPRRTRVEARSTGRRWRIRRSGWKMFNRLLRWLATSVRAHFLWASFVFSLG